MVCDEKKKHMRNRMPAFNVYVVRYNFSVCVLEYVCAQHTYNSLAEVRQDLGSLDLELQMIVSGRMVVGTEPRYSERAASVLNP